MCSAAELKMSRWIFPTLNALYMREKKPEAITVAAITIAAEGEKIRCIKSPKANTLGEFTLSCARAAKD